MHAEVWPAAEEAEHLQARCCAVLRRVCLPCAICDVRACQAVQGHPRADHAVNE